MANGPVWTGPNNNPSYFPAFEEIWVIPPFPEVGDGNWIIGPPVISLTDEPVVRIPPFVLGDTGVITPPTPPPTINDRGTFATVADIETEIDDNGVEPNDSFTLETGNGLAAGTWIWISGAIAPGGSYTLDPGDFSAATPAMASLKAKAKPKGRPKRR
jgi:hypothetical protein